MKTPSRVSSTEGGSYLKPYSGRNGKMSNREKYRHAMNTVIPSKEITAEDILELREEKKRKPEIIE